VQVTPAPGRPGTWRAAPWVQDGLVIRPVLDETSRMFEAVAASENDALAGTLNFLERRFGPPSGPPAPCLPVSVHIEAKAAPLRWKDRLN